MQQGNQRMGGGRGYRRYTSSSKMGSSGLSTPTPRRARPFARHFSHPHQTILVSNMASDTPRQWRNLNPSARREYYEAQEDSGHTRHRDRMKYRTWSSKRQ